MAIKSMSEVDKPSAYAKVQPFNDESDLTFSQSGKAVLVANKWCAASLLRKVETPLYGGYDLCAPQWWLMQNSISY
jgi:hypothetical protein